MSPLKTIFLIAKRYFLSTRKKNFINFISLISMLGVAFGTMALVVVLSVFNGLEGLIRDLFGTFDPDIKVTPEKGKSFEFTEEMKAKIRETPGVEYVTRVVEDNALLKYSDAQMVVKVKGVGDNFSKQNEIDSMTVNGTFKLREGDKYFAVVGRGIKYQVNLSLDNEFQPLNLWYPKGDLAPTLNPSELFSRKRIMPAGVFAIEKKYDNKYIFVPLKFARKLFNYENEITSLEIKVGNGYAVSDVEERLEAKLGSNFLIQNSDEQHKSLLRAIKIEKFFVFITLSLIVIIASFNIFFSLTMLVIDKKRDISILYAMGASRKFIRNLFLAEGAIIALTGTLLGLGGGFLICWLQQTFGLVPMGMESAVVDYYPVKMQFRDFLYCGITVVAITLIASARPSRQASRIDIRDYL